MRSVKRLKTRENLFFHNDRLAVALSENPRRLLTADGIVLAESDIKINANHILQSNNSNTPLRIIPEGLQQNYLPYGFLLPPSSTHLAAYNGQRLDPTLSCYALGNGHRYYSPRLMRFLQFDSLSPFSRGDINGYCYCQGDPINRVDPDGRSWHWVKRIGNWIVRQLPTVSFRRAITAGPTQTDHVDVTITLHRAGRQATPASPHVAIPLPHIEESARLANETIRAISESVEQVGEIVVPRVARMAAAGALGLAGGVAVFRATDNLDASSVVMSAIYAGSYVAMDRAFLSQLAGRIREHI